MAKLSKGGIHNSSKGTHPPASLAHRSKGSHLPVTSGYRPHGTKPPYLANPGFQVEQHPPTDAHPIRMQQQRKRGAKI